MGAMGWFILIVFAAMVAMQLRSGTIVLRGGRSIRRDRARRAFWLAVASEIAMLAILLGGLIFIH